MNFQFIWEISGNFARIFTPMEKTTSILDGTKRAGRIDWLKKGSPEIMRLEFLLTYW